MFQQLIPNSEPPQQAIRTAMINIVTGIKELIEEEASDVSNEWAEAADTGSDNIFMRDRIEDILSQNLAAFFLKVQPRASQLTDAHTAAALGMKPPEKVMP